MYKKIIVAGIYLNYVQHTRYSITIYTIVLSGGHPMV